MKTIVSTSWDDGEYTDLRLAEMLRARGVAATFYVPITPYQGRKALSHADLRNLAAEGFEIGAHTVSHRHLWNLSPEELAAEINPCRPILEDILGTEVRMFCYPRGRYDSNVIGALKQAGYWGARTVRMLATGLEFEPFEMPTTLQVSPQPKLSYLKNMLRGKKVDVLPACLANFGALGNWVTLGKRMFDSVMKHGGVWHIYGHSQEIEELGMWDEVREILDYVGGHKEVTYVPNGELIRARAPQTRFAEVGR